ncbi:YnfU family zinc-binding protein [Pectobacteriaceae bacterium CE70]|uniref:YnfU family zinc-binding protein n=1 Tax=Pectobacteriaceae TaxID=1903410 RepID=UPI000392660F|nr:MULTISPECIES: YnfU family zinc-binding protein [Enterobacterales]WJV58945.1 YnfU family zinc-binding protein [Pectobacteriaceae bacterium C111]WJV63220.1 YnfU family zinc-binding protein [Pectobacteriaceae bacterium C52]WJV67589.1 YnfU family zinc-binding protein [Pectobacteriaceae bacterium CE70]WJY11530.1 YnfU family zinc-binding protein [Pectobacteriaceae bacterium C80]WJY14391.1 YnfU family zinc-binding protein [Pectobacteriaceae bacterium CE90]
MSFLDGLKLFNERKVSIACPKCAYVTKQTASKISKDVTLICPNCGTLFLPKDAKPS